MTDDEKQALRNSMAGKKVSEMTEQERELFDQVSSPLNSPIDFWFL
jgi:hypothetical protein